MKRLRFDVRTGGFTLMELMITVAIIGILAAIAYPSYTQYVVRGKRVEAQAALMSLSQAMERHFVANNTYAGAAAGGASDGPPNETLLRVSDQSPESGTAVYNLTIEAETRTYVLWATPVAGTRQASDGFLQVNSQGVRRWDRNNDNDTGDAGEDTWDKR